MLARRAELDIFYNGLSISKEIASDLLSFSFTDNAKGTSDDISITLKDDHKKWMNSWAPIKGDSIKATIITRHWEKENEIKKLNCGTFIVDAPEYSGRPRILTLNAISSPVNTNFLSNKRTKVWNNVNFKSMVNTIAARYGLSVLYDIDSNPKYTSKEQSDTSDSSFISELCDDEGFAYKVTDTKIVIFDEEKYEKKKAVATFYEGNSNVKSYSFSTTYSETGYKAVKVNYYDSKKNQTISFVYSPAGEFSSSDKIYTIRKKVSSLDEAQRLARKTYFQLKKREFTAQLTIVGNIKLLASCCIELKDFGVYSGKYYIDKATHKLNGYEVSLELHKVV